MGENTWNIVLSPAIRGGILDSVNPGSMASWLLLFVIMILVARKYGLMAPYGSLFIMGIVMARSILVTGFLDKWILSRWFEVLLEVWYLIFSLTCLVVGSLFWKDWRLSNNKASPRKATLSYERILGPADVSPAIPFFKREKKWRWFFAAILRGLLFLLLGFLAAFLASAWAEDNYFIIMFMSLFPSQDVVKLLVMLECYVFFYVLPLILVFLLTWGIFRGKNSAEKLRTHYSLVQALGAALFLGYGISFLSYYLN